MANTAYTLRRFLRAHSFTVLPLLGLFAYSAPASADVVITPRVSCPVFHCTPESTGVMYQPIVAAVTNVVQNNQLGVLKAQGCSGNGAILTCIYTADTATDPYTGTLKALNAGTLAPLWGSASSKITDGYNISAKGVSIGLVPFILPNGQIAAGDSTNEALYDSVTGSLVKPLIPLDSKGGKNYGITPLVNGLGISVEDNDYAVISQSNGVFTLIQLSTWKKINSVAVAGLNNETVSLASPSSASGNTLYAIASNSQSKNGYLFSVRMDPNLKQLVAGPSFLYKGAPGSSPVIVKPAISGLDNTMVLLHTPQLVTDAAPQNHLVSLLDKGDKFELNPNWNNGTGQIPLPDSLGTAPSIDEKTKTIYYQFSGTTLLYANDIRSGKDNGTYNIQTAFGFPNGFKLNGHLVSVQTGDTYTVLLSGSVRPTKKVAGGQYVMAFQPALNKTLWSPLISDDPDTYTAAWALGPSSRSGIYCPIVIGTGGRGDAGSGISLLCDQ